jgi:transketolase
MRNAFVDALLERAKLNPHINLVVGDLGYGVVGKFEEDLPNQFLNAGVAEQSMLGLSAGMASTGKHVFVYSIANFPTFRALEQIRNDVCYHNLPVTIVSVGAGLGYGVLGYSHYAIEDIAIMSALPNIEIYSPSDSADAVVCLDQILLSKKPSYIRIGKGGEQDIFKKSTPINVGYNILRECYKDIVIVTGAITLNVLAAVDVINQTRDIPIGLISVNKIKPLNLPLDVFDLHSRVVVIEEHISSGGLKSLVLDFFSRNKLLFEISGINIESPTTLPLGSQEFVREKAGLSINSILSKLTELFS